MSFCKRYTSFHISTPRLPVIWMEDQNGDASPDKRSRYVIGQSRHASQFQSFNSNLVQLIKQTPTAPYSYLTSKSPFISSLSRTTIRLARYISMPPKQSTGAGGRGRPAGSVNKSSAAAKTAANSSKRATANTTTGANKKRKATLSDEENDSGRRRTQPEVEEEEEDEDDEDDEDDERESIPPELLSKIVHELFEHKETKITKDANNALSGYMDVFVREAIARAAAERKGVFLEVEDLEKVAAQLVLDL
ncbi:hypothetical protein QC763_310160 [Podospora pseudopauciseta]|uniref:Centromere protein X n=1 Tax=Podospora pseudopauciseta TaxID=2093780 RepID=A0ABR0HHI2_9PEZI|nr:hypothetical protein QC763_310160 [Podospora pseudopauciseta]